MTRTLPRYKKCFICGEDNPIGLKRTWRVEDDRIVTDFVPGEEHCGFQGVVHGGILTALLDECMGWTSIFDRRILCVSAELNIRFKHPTHQGDRLRIEAWLLEAKRRYYVTEGRIVREDGTVTVTGSGKFFPLSEEQMAEVEAYARWPKGW